MDHSSAIKDRMESLMVARHLLCRCLCCIVKREVTKHIHVLPPNHTILLGKDDPDNSCGLQDRQRPTIAGFDLQLTNLSK